MHSSAPDRGAAAANSLTEPVVDVCGGLSTSCGCSCLVRAGQLRNWHASLQQAGKRADRLQADVNEASTRTSQRTCTGDEGTLIEPTVRL